MYIYSTFYFCVLFCDFTQAGTLNSVGTLEMSSPANMPIWVPYGLPIWGVQSGSAWVPYGLAHMWVAQMGPI